MNIQNGETPVRIRLYSERYEVAVSLFETVFGQQMEELGHQSAVLTPEEELVLGLITEEDKNDDTFARWTDSFLASDKDEQKRNKDVETMEIISEGMMTVTDDRRGKNISISYAETELTGMEGAHTQINYHTSDPGLVTMTRSGTVTTALTFRSHTRTLCTYETPYMPFQVGIHCILVNNRMEIDGRLCLDYIIEIRGGVAERCRMIMTVSS